jgi:phytoene desaturase
MITVIGAGIGGLCAAALLSSQKKEVQIFESNSTPGGKMSEIQLGNYRFDTGPSLFTMPFILESIFEQCGEKLSDYLSYSSLEPLCRYQFPDGTVFNNFTDVSKTLQSIRSFSPEDEENYVRFLGKSADIYKKTANAFLFNPMADFSDFKSLNYLDLMKIDAFSTVSDSVDRNFESSYLKTFFKRFATYNGSSPYKAPATLNVIPYVELAQGGFYVKGGLFQIAKALEKLCLKMGVIISYNATVSEISVKNGKVIGIVSNEKFHKSEIVVSNADSVFTYTKLLSDKSLSVNTKASFQKVEPSSSGFVLMLGINRTYRNLAHHSIFFSSDYKKEFDEIFSEKKPATDPTIYIANTSFSDKEHAPEGHSNLFILVNTPFTRNSMNWNSLKDDYADMIIKKLRQYGLFDLDKHIVERHCITPNDFEQKYLSNKGSIYGISSNSRYAAFLRPRNRSPFIKGLYLVGGGTHPGGGIPLVSLSAKHAVTLINRDFPKL